VVLADDNIMNLKQNGFLIWLEGDVDILMKRMGEDPGTGNTRPSLTGIDPVVETGKVLEIRNPFYRKAADLAIITDMLSLEEVADRVMAAFSSQLPAVI
jgi:shikimate kinase